MEKSLQTFNFEEKQVRIITIENNPWWVAKDVCEVLDLTNPTMAIESLDEDERSKFSLGRQGEANIISESGLYTLIMRSNKPEAKNFRKWVTHEVLPSLRKTGEYTVNYKTKPEHTKIREHQATTARLKVNMERAKLILKLAENPKALLTDDSRKVLFHEGAKLLAGHDLLTMLPVVTEKRYSASDLAKEFGVTTQRIGIISNANKLKAPEGQSNKYGTWVQSKLENGSKEVSAWVYYEAGREWFADTLG